MSLVRMRVLIAVLHLVPSAAWVSQFAGLVLPVFMSCLQTSLNREIGFPAGLVPVARSPYRILPSFICLQRKQQDQHQERSTTGRDHIAQAVHDSTRNHTQTTDLGNQRLEDRRRKS